MTLVKYQYLNLFFVTGQNLIKIIHHVNLSSKYSVSKMFSSLNKHWTFFYLNFST